MSDGSVSGFRATSAERGRPLAAKGRVCAEAGCETRLSVYNDLEFCALHAPIVVPRMRGRPAPGDGPRW